MPLVMHAAMVFLLMLTVEVVHEWEKGLRIGVNQVINQQGQSILADPNVGARPPHPSESATTVEFPDLLIQMLAPHHPTPLIQQPRCNSRTC